MSKFNYTDRILKNLNTLALYGAPVKELETVTRTSMRGLEDYKVILFNKFPILLYGTDASRPLVCETIGYTVPGIILTGSLTRNNAFTDCIVLSRIRELIVCSPLQPASLNTYWKNNQWRDRFLFSFDEEASFGLTAYTAVRSFIRLNKENYKKSWAIKEVKK